MHLARLEHDAHRPLAHVGLPRRLPEQRIDQVEDVVVAKCVAEMPVDTVVVQARLVRVDATRQDELARRHRD